jgi:hypothetical protein
LFVAHALVALVESGMVAEIAPGELAERDIR